MKLLKKEYPETEFRVETVTTKGDKDKRPFFAIEQSGGVGGGRGGGGVFEKEVNDLLLRYKADFAVHSLKDLHGGFSDRLEIASVPKREKPHDVFINNTSNNRIGQLETGSIIGTSSIRRAIQIKTKYPHITIKSIRGNIETRIAKSKENGYTGIVLAESGMKRLGLDRNITQRLNVQSFTPAPGQGALAIVCRKDDSNIAEALEKIEHKPSREEIQAERALVGKIGAGCTVPLGALAITDKDRGRMSLLTSIYSLDGKRHLKIKESGSPEFPERLGEKVGDILISRGAMELTSEWIKNGTIIDNDIIKGIITQ